MSDSPNPYIAAARSSFASRSCRQRLPWPSDRPFRVLSIDGGGIRGIYPAAVLALCEREFLGGRSVADYFDLIVGTSTGGILALGLSVGRTAAEILEVYREDGRSIFPPGLFKRYLRNLRSLARYRYDRGALTKTLTAVLGNRILAEARTRLCIPAFEGHHGEVYIFKTPHHPEYRIDGHTPMTVIGQATSAAPTYFQALDEGGYRYVDGGVWANNPAMIGLVDVLACFQVEPRQVRMLSLGCGSEPTKVSGGQAVGGLFAWRGALFAAMNLQSQNALGQVGLLIGPSNLIRVGPRPKSPIAMDDWFGSMSLLPDEAAQTAKESGPMIAKAFFEERANVPTFYWPPVELNQSKVPV